MNLCYTVVVLSQLKAFTAENATVYDMVIPIVSALGFLLIGGVIAIFLLPQFLDKYILNPLDKSGKVNRDWVSLAILFILLLTLAPITYDAKASPLMGAFLAGLVFCSNKGAHHMFVSQFKRVMQWLLRIFFAASIGFQVPFHKFGKPSVILEGLFFTLALLGKLAVGFMVPNFRGSKRFKYTHLRDCLIVGFSMTAEGEFAFVIAVFGVANNMIPQDLYASVVLAVLLSTILGPFCLQKTISYFNKRIQAEVFGSNEEDDPNSLLEKSIRENTAVFWCIQTKSAPAWGLQTGIVQELTKLNLDVIDHRSWHPRQSDHILLNEVYVKDDSVTLGTLDDNESNKLLQERKDEITTQLSGAIHQANAIIRVQRWVPEIAHDDSPERNVTEHIVHATRDALKASMTKHDEEHGAPSSSKSLNALTELSPPGERSYRRMNTGGNHRRTNSQKGGMLGYRVIQVGPIDDLFTGKLEGLFRHDNHNDDAVSFSNNIGFGHGYEYDFDSSYTDDERRILGTAGRRREPRDKYDAHDHDEGLL